jgi:hypothetical protein
MQRRPLDPCCTWKEYFIDVCEAVFLFIFTAEMLIKILAYGFVLNRGSYLRDVWCQLDFVVVTLAWLPILRALRPLRALKRMPGMPVLVNWILSVLPKMGNVLMLCGFLFIIFGIIGMELFKGALHYRCALPAFVETPGHPVAEVYRRLDQQQQKYDSGIACNPLAASTASMPIRAAVSFRSTLSP